MIRYFLSIALVVCVEITPALQYCSNPKSPESIKMRQKIVEFNRDVTSKFERRIKDLSKLEDGWFIKDELDSLFVKIDGMYPNEEDIYLRDRLKGKLKVLQYKLDGALKRLN